MSPAHFVLLGCATGIFTYYAALPWLKGRLFVLIALAVCVPAGFLATSSHDSTNPIFLFSAAGAITAMLIDGLSYARRSQ